ncbi:hypothetical protein [Nocardia salmonicida]|uniref:hypothetical protein n=1 Tax=Nocardia salmonicida TaxID=53431 RepID=UPI003401C2BB
MSAEDDAIELEAVRLVAALEIMLSNRQIARLLLPRARAGDPKAAAIMRRIVEQMRGMGLSGPPLIALLTEEV